MSSRSVIVELSDDHYPPQVASENVDPLRQWVSKNTTAACYVGGHMDCSGVCAKGSQVVEERPCLCPCHLPVRGGAMMVKRDLPPIGQRINWAGKTGLFLTEEEVDEVAGMLNRLADRFDFEVEDQDIATASALCLRLVQAIGGEVTQEETDG